MTIRLAVYNCQQSYTSGIKNTNFGRKIEMLTYILHMKFNHLKNVLLNKL